MARREPAVVGDIVMGRAAALERDHHGESAQVGESVAEQVVENRGAGARRGDRGHPDQDVAGVRDRRVGEHPLDIGLHQRGQVARRHRQHRHHPQHHRPVRAERPQVDHEDAQEAGKRRDLHAHRHESRDRRRRALVGVGRPHMEGHGGDLEAEADQQQADAGQQQRIVGRRDARARLRSARA